jgi:hypothetical protein
MKILYKTAILLLLLSLFIPVQAQETDKPKVLTGFSGGMMLHTGYWDGRLPQVGYRAKGAPFGIGGAIRLHLGQHWMVGSEGYVSTLRQLHNGSYVRYGWGGVLGAFYWSFPHVAPYAGLTVGGGGRTAFLMFDGNSKDWQAENTVYFHKQSFCAVTPFIGCDFIATSFLHITVKADWLCPIAHGELLAPNGPRFYVGIIFYH